MLKGHEMPVTGIAFMDDKTVVSASMDRTIRVWDITVPEPKPVEKKEPKDKKGTKKNTKRIVMDSDVQRCLRVLCGLRDSVVNGVAGKGSYEARTQPWRSA